VALLVPDAGEVSLWEDALKTTTPEGQTLKLYTNDYDPVEGSISTDFTEASGNGYSAIPLTRGSWSVATSTGTTTATYAQQTFTFTGGPVTVYGYYIVHTTTTTDLLWAEKFASAASIPAGGGDIKITLNIELA